MFPGSQLRGETQSEMQAHIPATPSVFSPKLRFFAREIVSAFA